MADEALSPLVTQQGHLLVATAADAPALAADLRGRLAEAFARGSGYGLLQLGAGEVGGALPPSFAYWRDFAARYVAALCASPDAEVHGKRARIPPPPAEELESLAADAPPMTGAEYLSVRVLRSLWEGLDAAFCAALTESGLALQNFLRRRNPAWNLVGRVHFNLAENRQDEQAPFAFLATYTTRLSAHAKAQHLPGGDRTCAMAR